MPLIANLRRRFAAMMSRQEETTTAADNSLVARDASSMESGSFLNSSNNAVDNKRKEGPFLVDTEYIIPKMHEKFNLFGIVYHNRGGFGAIYRAKDNDGNQVAVKIIRSRYRSGASLKKWANRTKREMFYLSKIKHDNIVRFYGHAWLKVGQEHFTRRMIRPLYQRKPNCLLLATEFLATDLEAVLKNGPLSIKSKFNDSCYIVTMLQLF